MQKLNHINIKQFILLSIPITLQTLTNDLVGIIDNFMIGRLGVNQLAALKICSSFIIFFLILLWAFSHAGEVIAAQAWGKGNIEEFKKICGINVMITFIIGLLLCLVIFFFNDHFIQLISKDSEVNILAQTYFSIFAIGFIFIGINTGLTVTFITSSDTVSPLIQQIITTVLNITLNYLLIFGNFGFPALGIKGAAIASVISLATGSAVLILLGIIKDNRTQLLLSYFTKISNFKEIARIGLPILFDMFVWQFAMIVYLKIIGFAGTNALAVYSIIGVFFTILYIAISGFQTGSSIITGQHIGKKDYEQAFDFANRALLLTILITLIPCIIIASLSPFIPGWFHLMDEANTDAIICLLILAGRQVFVTANGMICSIIRAGKDTKYIMYVTIIGFIGIGLPLTLLTGVVLKLGIIFIFLSLSIEEVVKSFILFYRFKKKKWLAAPS